MRRSWIVGLALVLLGTPVLADEPAPAEQAKAHLDRGLDLYEKKEYAAAIIEFEKGYVLDPQPAFLYAQAQAERLGGDCEHAIGHYEKFLEQNPVPEREAAARANLGRCKDELAAKGPAPQPIPAPAQPSGAPAPAPAAPATQGTRNKEQGTENAPAPSSKTVSVPSEEAPWYSDVLGDVLVGSGVVALAVGGYLYAVSVANENKAEKSSEAPGGDTYDVHAARIDRAERQRTLGAISAGAGVLLVTGGVLRYVLHSRAPAAPAVGLWATPGASGVRLEHRF